MTTKEIFDGVIGFWEKTALPRMSRLNIDLSNDEINKLAKELVDIGKDKSVDGIDFIWKDIVRDDGRLCVVGTQLDVRDNASLIYPYYKRYMVLAKSLIVLTGGDGNYKALQEKHCSDVDFTTIIGCIKGIKDLMDELFNISGVFNTIRKG